MDTLLSKTWEFVEKHKQTYNSLFGVDLSNIDVQDSSVMIEDTVSNQIKNNKKFDKAAESIALQSNLSLHESRLALEKAAREAMLHNIILQNYVPLMLFGSPNYRETIFVIDHPENQKYLESPFSYIEYGTIHELGHSYYHKISSSKNIVFKTEEEAVVHTMSSEGFADTIVFNYVLPNLKSENLLQESNIYKNNYGNINHIIDEKFKWPIIQELFFDMKNKISSLPNAFAFNLFSSIDSNFGIDGLKKSVNNLPELRDYLSKDNDYLKKLENILSEN